MLKAVLLISLLAISAPAQAGERVLETRECIHPEVIKRLMIALKSVESSGESINPMGEWNNCEPADGASGEVSGEFHAKDEKFILYRMYYEEDKEGKAKIFIQKIRKTPDLPPVDPEDTELV